jgi:hypothetical protein
MPAIDEEGEWRELARARSDFTGDQLEDVIELGETSLKGLRGTDGQELWSVAHGGQWVWFAPAGRLDADARDDLFVTEFLETETAGEYTMTFRLRAISGASGTQLWERSYAEVWQSITIPDPLGYGYGRSDATNLGYADIDYAFPVAFTDLTGDGALDVAVIRYDSAGVDGQVVWADGLAAVLDVVSGTDGTVGGQFAGVGVSSWTDALVVPDLTGDAKSDVVTISGASAGGSNRDLRLAAFPGKGGAPVWQATVSVPSNTWLDWRGVELNGDGKGDVLLSQLSFTSGTLLRALSGVDGAQMWTRNLPSFASTSVAGDANGDGGADLLVEGEDYGSAGPEGEGARSDTLAIPTLPGHEGDGVEASDYGPSCDAPPYGSGYEFGGCYTEAFFLVDGKTGGLGWQWASETGFYAHDVGDIDGDGVIDLLSQGARLIDGRWHGVRSLRSGKTGQQVWEQAGPGSVWELGGDVDGDGKQDLVLVRQWYGDSERYTRTLISGANGGRMDGSLFGDAGELIWFEAARLQGDGADLLETTSTDGSRLSAFDGQDGSLIWRR